MTNEVPATTISDTYHQNRVIPTYAKAMIDAKEGLRKTEELRSFLFLTAVMVPVLTVMFIAAYGFVVWFYQILVGGPPH